MLKSSCQNYIAVHDLHNAIMKHELLNTSWMLIESMDWGGWTIYVNANY